MTFFLMILVLIAILVLYGWYASIVTRNNRVLEALGGIDAQLQQRLDLIPNVLAIARRFMEHERSLLDELTRLRAEASARAGERDFARLDEKFATEDKIGASLNRIFAIAEGYPDLKSQGPMMEAQRSYNEVENNIAAARRFYNAAVAGLRNAVQIFPGTMLASLAGVASLPPFFQTTDAARVPVKVEDHL